MKDRETCEKKEPKINIALIGCGSQSAVHVECYEALGKFNVAAVCDVYEERAEEYAEKIRNFQRTTPKVYTDYRRMLEGKQKIEAVDICTNHASHHEVATACFEAGKHVLIEKPLGITMKACKKMIDAAQKNGKLLAVAEGARMGKEERARNWAIKQGYIGKPRMLFWIDVEERLPQWGWRDFKLKAGGGWVLDGGVHFVNVMRYFLGEAIEVYGVSAKFEPYRYKNFGSIKVPWAFFHKWPWPPGPEKVGPIKVDVEDTISATIEFEDNVLAQWIYTCTAPGKPLCIRTIYGDKGYMDLSSKEELRSKDRKLSIEELVKEYLATLSRDEMKKLFPSGLGPNTHTETTLMENFGNAILKREKIELDGVEGLKDMAIPMAIYESAWLGEPVKVRDVEECRIENYQKEINEALNIS